VLRRILTYAFKVKEVVNIGISIHGRGRLPLHRNFSVRGREKGAE